MTDNKEKPDLSILKDLTILYVEDDIDVHKSILEFLQMHFNRIYSAYNGQEGMELFQRRQPDIVLTDIRMPVMDGLEMSAKIRESGADTPIIIISAFYEVDLLMKAIEIGIDKYIRKPTDGTILLNAIYRSGLPVVQEKEIRSLNEKLLTSLEARISKSNVMKDIIKQIHKVAKSDFSIIIHGETGVGKSHIARIIHELSRRADKPFIKVDVGVIPETLIESELFGHTKGAFTGADANKKGFFEVANGGTLVLEDLENLTPFAQSKLLQAVENKEIFPVGSTSPVKVDIRIIGATNKNIFDEVKGNRFREDLFYRLCEFDIKIPPLRERLEDIPWLAGKFVSEVAAELDKSTIHISDEAMEILQKHPWKGNARELKNAIRRASLLCEDNRITGEEIQKILRLDKDDKFIRHPGDLSDYSLSHAVMDAEKFAVLRALKKTAGKKVKAASLLGIDYKTLISKMVKFDI